MQGKFLKIVSNADMSELSAKVSNGRLMPEGIVVGEAFGQLKQTRVWDILGADFGIYEVGCGKPYHVSLKGRRFYAQSTDWWGGVQWSFFGGGVARAVRLSETHWLLETDFPRPSFMPRMFLQATGQVVPDGEWQQRYAEAVMFIMADSLNIGLEALEYAVVAEWKERHYLFAQGGLFEHVPVAMVPGIIQTVANHERMLNIHRGVISKQRFLDWPAARAFVHNLCVKSGLGTYHAERLRTYGYQHLKAA